MRAPGEAVQVDLGDRVEVKVRRRPHRIQGLRRPSAHAVVDVGDQLLLLRDAVAVVVQLGGGEHDEPGLIIRPGSLYIRISPGVRRSSGTLNPAT